MKRPFRFLLNSALIMAIVCSLQPKLSAAQTQTPDRPQRCTEIDERVMNIHNELMRLSIASDELNCTLVNLCLSSMPFALLPDDFDLQGARRQCGLPPTTFPTPQVPDYTETCNLLASAAEELSLRRDRLTFEVRELWDEYVGLNCNGRFSTFLNGVDNYNPLLKHDIIRLPVIGQDSPEAVPAAPFAAPPPAL